MLKKSRVPGDAQDPGLSCPFLAKEAHFHGLEDLGQTGESSQVPVSLQPEDTFIHGLTDISASWGWVKCCFRFLPLSLGPKNTCFSETFLADPKVTQVSPPSSPPFHPEGREEPSHMLELGSQKQDGKGQ